MEAYKFRIIEEVRKRPLLWDLQNLAKGRNCKKCDAQWIEIGKILGMNAHDCKRIWKRLRVQFCNEMKRIPLRIRKAKEKGSYDPNKKYYSWYFFDALRFVAQGRSSQARFASNFENDSDVEIVESNNEDQTQSEHLFDSNSFQTESDNDVEIVDCNNLDQIQSQQQKHFENNYESDNDIEIIDNTNLDQQPPNGNFFENNFISHENSNASEIIPIADSDDSEHVNTNFKSYTVSLSNYAQEDECDATIFNDNNILQNDTAIKEEPELQIEIDIEKEKEDVNEFLENKSSRPSTPALSHCSESSNLLVASSECEQDEQPTFSEETTSTPGANDEDYCFLYSFLTQTKRMTQLQKMEFRARMKSLLLNIFPASASVNILEKQLLLPEDNDPDRKFLISFWPFIKSMSFSENLQFRAKMSDLVLKVLSTDMDL